MLPPRIDFTPTLVKLVAEIDEFKGSWVYYGKLSPERLQRLRRIATIESIGSSTRIEGAKLTDAEVEALLSGLDVRSFRSRDEEEVAGYGAVMETVFSSYGEIGLTENHIKQLHGDLLKFSSKDVRHRGEYKKFPNHVEAFDSDGKSLGVVFETAMPFDTPRLMSELIAWSNTALDGQELHVLIVIAVFVVQFLAIHPFQDGNGRLSRVLTTLLLLRFGYSYVPYSSLERVVEENKDQYYLALRQAQGTFNTDDSKLSVWVQFFLETLRAQKDSLSRKLEREQILTPLPAVAEQIMEIAREQGRVTVREAEKLTGVSRNTIKFHIQKLVSEGLLKKHGRGKGTWYTL